MSSDDEIWDAVSLNLEKVLIPPLYLHKSRAYLNIQSSYRMLILTCRGSAQTECVPCGCSFLFNLLRFQLPKLSYLFLKLAISLRTTRSAPPPALRLPCI